MDNHQIDAIVKALKGTYKDNTIPDALQEIASAIRDLATALSGKET